MKIRKSFAGIAATALAISGIAVATAPAADAYSGSVGLKCRIYFSDAGVGSSPSTYTDTYTLTQSPANPNAGQVVTVTFAASTGTINGPVPLAANVISPKATIAVTGATTATVVASDGPTDTYPASATAAATALGAYSLTGTYTAAGNGSAQLALAQLKFDDGADGAGTGSNVDTYCSNSGTDVDHKAAPVTSTTIVQAFTVTGPNGSVVTSSGQNAGVQAVRMSAAYTSTVVLTGAVFGANATVGQVTAQFCDVTGASCVNPGYTDSNSLSVTGGALSGAILHTPGTPGPTTGNRAIKVVNTVDSSTALIPVLVLGTATVSVSPAQFGPGTAVSVSGSNFNPSQAVTIYGSSLATPPYTATVDASGPGGTASGTGAFGPSLYTVNASNTLSVVAYQGIPGAPSASNPANAALVTINPDRCVAYNGNLTGGPGCATSQTVTATVNAGKLTQRAYTTGTNPDATTIALAAITSPLAPTAVPGSMNEIAVSDSRGGAYGWSLTASLTNFTGVGLNTINKSKFAVTPACAASTNASAWDYAAVGKTAVAGYDDTLNASGVTAGGGGNFTTAQTLCTKNITTNATTQTTGGIYNVTGGVVLTVPAFQAADAYSAVMTVTLA